MGDEVSTFSLTKVPVYTWQCELFGVGQQMVLMREEGKQPNWFWRQMQFLVLGNKWSRVVPRPSQHTGE